MRYTFLIFIFLLNSSESMAANFYQNSHRGWFWFESQKVEEKSIDKQQNPLRDNNTISAADQLKEFQEKMEEAKAAMIMAPSVQNARAYIKYQNEMFLKSELVSSNWQSALLMYPELNIVKDKPISQAGMNITREVETINNDRALKAFAKGYQLLFFYKADCPYCEKFAQVLEHFSHKHGYKVASITLDGKNLAKFPGTLNLELARKLKVEFTPSLFAFSPQTGITMPLAHGFLTIDLLERNVLFAIKQLGKKDENIN